MINSQRGVDWAERIDYNKLREGRLEKAKKVLEENNLDALVVFEAENIRYIAGTVAGPSALGSRFCILPKGKEPIMFEIGGDVGRVKLCAPWLSGRIRIAMPLKMLPGEMSEQWGLELKKILKEEGIKIGRIGIDMINFKLLESLNKVGIDYIEAASLLWQARMIKTKEEIECIRQSVLIAESCFDAARRVIRPGIREHEIQIEMVKVLHSFGAEGLAVVASGEHTNPYWRIPLNDRILRHNDLVIIDRFHSLNGYWCDYVRTLFCGDKATDEQKELFKIAYDGLYEAIKEIKPGVLTSVIAEKLNEPEDLSEFTLQLGHGIGLGVHEPPFITCFSKKYPVEIKKGMVLAIENYVGRSGGKDGVRLEENLIVTDDGYEIISKYPFEPKLMD